MEINYQIIAVFSSSEMGYTGNPAAVVLLDDLLSDEEMQQIAEDLDQPATTFLVKRAEDNSYDIRWFAPDAEIGLCGHGTAAAVAYLGTYSHAGETYHFYYRDGRLRGRTNEDGTVTIYVHAIPVLEELETIPEAIKDGLRIPLLAMFRTGNKYILQTDNEKSLKEMNPDFGRLRDSDIFGYAVTAKGDSADFVSRTLVPHTKSLEDFATGSSHAMLVPFWANRLKKNHLKALQLSERGGAFQCEMDKSEVKLTGEYFFEMKGELLV